MASWAAAIAAVAARSNWSTAGNRSRSSTSWGTGRGRSCTRRSTSSSSRSGTSWSTCWSGTRWCTSSRSGTARSSGTTAVVVVEQAGLSAVHAGQGDQRGGNPNKLHCILQVHHGRGNVRNCGNSDQTPRLADATVQGSEFASHPFFRLSAIPGRTQTVFDFESADDRRPRCQMRGLCGR